MSEILKKYKAPVRNAEIDGLIGLEKGDEGSLDELRLVLQTLADMQEQIWARCRSNQCASDVKLMLTSISRPTSALNRLASFLQWPLSDIPSRMTPP